MSPAHTARALLLGGDASLTSLLSDVLGELGIALDLGVPDGGQPDFTLVHVERGEGILRLLGEARALTGDGPLIVLVPFADERLVQLALKLGARDCFALGQPLAELSRVLCAHVPGLRALSSRTSGGAVPPSPGDES
ncbi:DNA-binding response regulator [Pyxidicoccus xibeiensis]|uniref:DNA-binding response regulator n=1 Tax=Pyxidicoccus xibeiensis TaxID=2906759 RepID=UPI0020A70950|nr:DNA-binding response regulator [Pyxidicoccus xibeiensis]MCP3137682.1 DNA-binding response regulator [Pyxidicoccus xibeiensis]